MFALQSILVITALCFPLFSRAQFISSLPQCIRDCIDQSQYDNCEATDIGCLCRASAGNFLPNLITCIRGSCDLDASALLVPLQAVCIMAGAPIPDKAIQNAENQATTVAPQVTTTVTVGQAYPTWDSYTVSTVYNGYPELSTITETKTQDGETITAAYPVTVWRTSTVSASRSSSTSISTPTKSASHSNDSTSTTFTTQSTTSSTAATSGIPDTSSSVTTTLKGAQTSSSASGARPTNSFSEDEANSSPFKDTNLGVKDGVGKLLGLTVVLMLGMLWL